MKGKISVIFILLSLLSFVHEASAYRRGSGFNEGDLEMEDYSILFAERIEDPDATLSDEIKLYAKDSGGTTKIFTIDSLGTVTELGAGGGDSYTNLTEFVDQTNWRLFYSNGSGDVTELALGSAGQLLRSAGATSAPEWTAPTFPNSGAATGSIIRANGTNWLATSATYPNTTTINRILYSSNNDIIGQITTANSGVLVTSGTGVPSISSTLPAGLTIPAPTLLVIPNGTAPTADDAGEIAHDTTADQLILDDHVVGAKNTRIYIPVGTPTAGTYPLGNVDGFTISQIRCQVTSATNMVIQLIECGSDGASCSDVDSSDITCDTDGATDDGSLTNAVIDKDDLFKLEIVSVSGTPGTGSVTIIKETVRE